MPIKVPAKKTIPPSGPLTLIPGFPKVGSITHLTGFFVSIAALIFVVSQSQTAQTYLSKAAPFRKQYPPAVCSQVHATLTNLTSAGTSCTAIIECGNGNSIRPQKQKTCMSQSTWNEYGKIVCTCQDEKNIKTSTVCDTHTRKCVEQKGPLQRGQQPCPKIGDTCN